MRLTHSPTGIDSRDGWTVAGAAFLATFAVFGVAYSFGAVFTALRDEFGSSEATTSWFFNITTFLYFVIGIFTGRFADRHGPRVVLVIGAVAMTTGLLLTATIDRIWLGFLTYGIGVGTAVACAYVPMVSAVGAWFEHRRTTALGVSVAGIGTGTLVGAPAAKALTDAHGWRTTYVILGLVSGALLLLAAALAKRPPVSDATPPPPPVRTLIRQLARTPAFVWLYVAMSLTSMSLFVPFVYMDAYLEDRGSSSGALVIGVIGAMSVIGRLGLAAIAGRVRLISLYLAANAFLPLTFLIWLAVDTNLAALLLFGTLMGLSYGGFIALAPAVTARLFGAEGLGAVLGALYTSAGVGGLLGPYLVGQLVDISGYSAAIIAAMVVALLAVPCLVMVSLIERSMTAD